MIDKIFNKVNDPKILKYALSKLEKTFANYKKKSTAIRSIAICTVIMLVLCYWLLSSLPFSLLVIILISLPFSLITSIFVYFLMWAYYMAYIGILKQLLNKPV